MLNYGTVIASSQKTYAETNLAQGLQLKHHAAAAHLVLLRGTVNVT